VAAVSSETLVAIKLYAITSKKTDEEREKNMVMCPAGPGTENDCAGEDQQQFTLNRNPTTANIGNNCNRYSCVTFWH
jgi:hypothetical protein